MKRPFRPLGKCKGIWRTGAIGIVGLVVGGVFLSLQSSELELELEAESSWNKARETYFRGASDPIQPYRMDGVKGRIVDLRFYSTPDPDLVLVTFGETYFNTTGWDLHVALVRRDGQPVYPGNVHLSPNGADIAVDWIDGTTLGVFYHRGFYPDRRDPKTGIAERNPDFTYGKEVDATSVRFIGVDSRELDERRWSMDSRRLVATADKIETNAPTLDLFEPWDIVFDLMSWAASTRPAGREVVERVYVPEGQTPAIWREMVTSALNPGNLAEQLASLEMLREHFSANCPGFEFEILEESTHTFLVQWSHEGCQGEPPLFRIGRLVETPEGVLSLLYAAKIRDVPDKDRQKWQAAIQGAAVRPGGAGRP